MKTKIVSVILIMALVAACLCACNPQRQVATYTLQYFASEGGAVIGEALQTVEEGKDGEAVLAVADDGYYFVGWSDGITEPIRQETNVSCNVTVTAQFEKSVPSQPTEYTVQYLCNQGGSIQGQTTQTVEQGQDATPVTAVAEEGYEFVKWSDDVTTATRQDKNIERNVTVTAIFKEIEQPSPITKTYSLNYNFGEAEEKPESITFVEGEIEGITLPVLTREHFTFHGWYCNDEQVADTSGQLLLEEELLTLDGEKLYAKFTANETFTYKILLCYVTRIDAILPHKDPSVTEKIHVDYTMSELEREFYHLLTVRLKQQFDGMLDGLVEFQVDEYYTTKTFTTEDFHTTVGNTRHSYLYLKEVAEVSDILPQYDSGLILFNAYSQTRNHTGSASRKYGEVRMDSFYDSLEASHVSLKQVVDSMKYNEDLVVTGFNDFVESAMIDPMVHELAHTIEIRMNLYNYHKCINNEHRYLGSFERNRRYFFHETVIEGEKVGVPYEFWAGNIAKCKYLVTTDSIMGSQGYVSVKRQGFYFDPVGSGNTLFDALFGEYVTVTAIPGTGYKFIQWSDGITTPERTDLITGDFTVTAIFEEI